MKKTTLSSKKCIAAQNTFASAIKSLRVKLGETQESMARLVRITLRGYLAWERAEAEPRGRHLLRLIQICPDVETRATLGLDPYVSPTDGLPTTPGNRISGESTKGIEDRETAHRGIELLFEGTQKGSGVASEQLTRFAREILRAAGDAGRLTARDPAERRQKAVAPRKKQR